MALSKHIVISASRAVSAATALSRTLPSMRRDCWTPTAITTCDHGYGTYRSDGRRHNSSTAIEAGSHKPNSALKRQDLFYKNLNPPENFPRTVLVLRLPRFAIHEDVQQIFEESGFPVERILMSFTAERGHNRKACEVVMHDEATASAAIKELNGASLFDSKLEMSIKRQKRGQPERRPFLSTGWEASDRPEVGLAFLREPLLEPPKDLFAPVREGRRITFDNFPVLEKEVLETSSLLGGPKKTGPLVDVSQTLMYQLLHNYNVTSLSRTVLYLRKPEKSLIRALHVDFASKDEADHARLTFNNFSYHGSVLGVATWQIPMKHLGVSWDSGRKGGHFSGRDQGSAVGTNFEEEQEKLFRKAILGKHDRKLWIPSHRYR